MTKEAKEKATDKKNQKAVSSAKKSEKKKGKTAEKKAPAKGKKAGLPSWKDLHFGEMDQYYFGHATHYDIYRKMGAHQAIRDGEKGVLFVVWAPNALSASVVGDFNKWDPLANEMNRISDMGIFEIFVPGVAEGDLYKFSFITPAGERVYRADPYAFTAEKRPGTASRVAVTDYEWGDEEWIRNRRGFDIQKSALSIYEVHPGSWMKHPYSEENPEGFYTYRQLARSLTKYVKDMGYTHVELMGIAEHPLDASWGYQVTGYYAPTSRYGTPQDFKYLVDYLHKHKIGVILDWVPGHFPKDEFGLANFDGEAVYEHADPRKGEHKEWGTKVFNYSRPQVKNFLLGNALYWIEECHIDGLRVDAVASMLYLDYCRAEGEWIPNENGGNENLEAVEFFKHLNTLVRGRNKGVIMIAEESTTWPKLTADVEYGGLNFSYKWNMGWMHDFLDYMKLDPYFRKFNHNKMTFALTYAFSENFILVLSHDEVVHLKCSMLSKMPGLDGDKFENLKAGYSFMIGHPGKKLLFMGQDIGQYREWSEEREIDWYLLQDPKNEHLQAYVRDLLKMYKKYPALYANDTNYEGFSWINANDADRSIFSFVRWSPDGKDHLLFVVNFTPIARPDYRCGLPLQKNLKLILDSRTEKYGGDHVAPKTYHSAPGECDGQPFSFAYDLPPYGVAVFKFS